MSFSFDFLCLLCTDFNYYYYMNNVTALYCTVHAVIHVTHSGTCVQIAVLSLAVYFPFHQFSQLINNQKRLGSDKFPLIDQTFYPNYRDMVRSLFVCPLMIFRYRYLDFCVFISLTVYFSAVKMFSTSKGHCCLQNAVDLRVWLLK